MADQANGNGVVSNGLQGVSIGGTEIGLVDGENGRLVYRGHDAERLAQEATYEDTAFLLWHGRLPSDDERADLSRALAEGMTAPAPVIETIRGLGEDVLVIDALRTGLSHWSALRRRGEGGDADDATWAVGATIGLVADIQRVRRGEDPVAADPGCGVVENYLTKMNGERPPAARARALDAYFTLAAEHGMNASTFTARVIVSTLSDLGSGLVGAVCAMKGRLHGGAPSHVITMLEEIGTADNAEPWLRARLEGGDRLMGFGHRVYKTYDPRARALGVVAQELASQDERLALARHVEETAVRLLEEYKPGRRLYTNVEYYAAAVLGNIQLPPDLYTPTFAAARTAGWTAHMLEQLAHNKLIRPSVDYVGPLPA
jgi:citrate synthase